MRYFKIILALTVIINLFACTKDDGIPPRFPKRYNILALGDSYTIGQNVCETCSFPKQLKDSLKRHLPSEDSLSLDVIAQTGWTTRNLIEAINNQVIPDNYDFVTLLIGVNNEFQNQPISVYQTELPILVQTAINSAKGNKTKVVVLSIPDYAFTPFGQTNGNPWETSVAIDLYNTFTENYCNQEQITFLNITDISRLGLDHPDLVSIDGLHLSELAYAKFIDRLLPVALSKIE